MRRSRDTGICLVQKVQRKQRLLGFRIFSSIRYAKIIYLTRTWKIQCVEGDGNCLPTSVMKTLDFDKDPGSDKMYTQIYLRRAVVMHLISMWEILGADITENI